MKSLNSSTRKNSGLLLLNKEVGTTSFYEVERLRRLFKDKNFKAGHGGTLDPFAEGLLIVLLGQGVKLSRYILESQKTYEAKLIWGIKTASGDTTLPVLEECAHRPKNAEEILNAVAEYFQNIPYLQTPPMFSAKKVDGRPLYELARRGIEVERKPKLCFINKFEILEFNLTSMRFSVDVSSGTYIRTFAEDLAKKLGTLAALSNLKRTQTQNAFLKDAITFEELKKIDHLPTKLETCTTTNKPPWFVPFNESLKTLCPSAPSVLLNETETYFLKTGQQGKLETFLNRVNLDYSPTPSRADILPLYFESNLVGVLRKNEVSNRFELERVFN